ncbi:MAG: hypothetical protein PHY93_21160 [Bacteriovorax sp.]|nr:hypothetical protein [Bacteriovorax sp.]
MERKLLRHGWGGDIKKRRESLQEKDDERMELEEYPFLEAKFGSGFVTREDYLLLEQMSEN